MNYAIRQELEQKLSDAIHVLVVLQVPYPDHFSGLQAVARN